MKASKPISLLLTNDLKARLDNYLKEQPTTFKCDKTYFYYIINHLLIQQNINKNRCNGTEDYYTQLNIKSLQAKTINNIGAYIKILKNGEFIKCNESYKVGKSLGQWYCINSNYLKGTIVSHEVPKDHPLFRRILKQYENKRSHNNRLDNHLQIMCKAFMKLELDYDKANSWIMQEPKEYKRMLYTSSISNLNDKRFRYFKRNRTNNRLDTNLTNLKSNLRQFIVGDYVSIDLKISQPFLSMLLESIINNNREGTCYLLDNKEIVKTFGIKPIVLFSKIHQDKENEFLANLNYYNESVLKGKLYENFVLSYTKGITRDEVKQITFEVLFSKNESYQNKKIVFNKVLPYVLECVKALKKYDHSLLPIYLQKIESYIFIDCIAKELVQIGIIPFTIHDSIIVKNEQIEKALSIIKNVFYNQFGIVPTFKIETLKAE
ncbi:MAG: hypothetical protein IPH89_13520 [Bacteroidetes bacterium]|nr:hypothetical protein [Bacteroidota bacterium]